jgi:uncharacterized protein YdhG (YjbR/CyaY superfamily)
MHELGTLRFPLDTPIPWGILKKVVRYRVEENVRKAKTNGRRSGETPPVL